VVAGAAHVALMKFDRQLQLGMRQHLQRVNLVNIDAATTSVFIQTFTAASRQHHPHTQGSSAVMCANKNTPVNKHNYFPYSSEYFCKFFRDYFRTICHYFITLSFVVVESRTGLNI